MLLNSTGAQCGSQIMFNIPYYSRRLQELRMIAAVSKPLLSEERVKLVVVSVCDNPSKLVSLSPILQLDNEFRPNTLYDSIKNSLIILRYSGIWNPRLDNATQ
jgi:hypothetical protein